MGDKKKEKHTKPKKAQEIKQAKNYQEMKEDILFPEIKDRFQRYLKINEEKTKNNSVLNHPKGCTTNTNFFLELPNENCSSSDDNPEEKNDLKNNFLDDESHSFSDENTDEKKELKNNSIGNKEN